MKVFREGYKDNVEFLWRKTHCGSPHILLLERLRTGNKEGGEGEHSCLSGDIPVRGLGQSGSFFWVVLDSWLPGGQFSRFRSSCEEFCSPAHCHSVSTRDGGKAVAAKPLP